MRGWKRGRRSLASVAGCVAAAAPAARGAGAGPLLQAGTRRRALATALSRGLRGRRGAPAMPTQTQTLGGAQGPAARAPMLQRRGRFAACAGVLPREPLLLGGAPPARRTRAPCAAGTPSSRAGRRRGPQRRQPPLTLRRCCSSGSRCGSLRHRRRRVGAPRRPLLLLRRTPPSPPRRARSMRRGRWRPCCLAARRCAA